MGDGDGGAVCWCRLERSVGVARAAHVGGGQTILRRVSTSGQVTDLLNFTDVEMYDSLRRSAAPPREQTMPAERTQLLTASFIVHRCISSPGCVDNYLYFCFR
jgi:hypothetical protein